MLLILSYAVDLHIYEAGTVTNVTTGYFLDIDGLESPDHQTPEDHASLPSALGHTEPCVTKEPDTNWEGTKPTTTTAVIQR